MICKISKFYVDFTVRDVNLRFYIRRDFMQQNIIEFTTLVSFVIFGIYVGYLLIKLIFILKSSVKREKIIYDEIDRRFINAVGEKFMCYHSFPW